MLIAARHLVDRLRHPRSRADEIRALRERIVAATAGATEEERALALELRRLRVELAAAFREVRSCAGCARGYPEPHGHWEGGHCCGGRTDGVFTDDEVAALALAGTTPAVLRPPVSDHAGCAFRGPQGCSLDVADRPSVCTRYVCRGLEGELRERGEWARISALGEQLRAAAERFGDLRAARQEDVALAELARALEEAR